MHAARHRAVFRGRILEGSCHERSIRERRSQDIQRECQLFYIDRMQMFQSCLLEKERPINYITSENSLEMEVVMKVRQASAGALGCRGHFRTQAVRRSAAAARVPYRRPAAFPATQLAVAPEAVLRSAAAARVPCRRPAAFPATQLAVALDSA